MTSENKDLKNEIKSLLNKAVLTMGEPAEDGLHIMRAEALIGKAMSLIDAIRISE